MRRAAATVGGRGRSIVRNVWRVAVAFTCVAAAQAISLAQEPRYQVERAFFQASFERANGKTDREAMDAAFSAVVATVENIQRRAPNVTLGGMLSLIVFESGAKRDFYNTRDAENSFKKRLDKWRPFAEQPFARYSYQFGLVPVHTSLLRPCMPGTQATRAAFDRAADAAGFKPDATQLAALRAEFDEVCSKVLRGAVKDAPRAADYYVLNSHRTFGVPTNGAGSDRQNSHAKDFALYSPRVTTPLFFFTIAAEAGKRVLDDRSAICVWGGGDKTYCDLALQDRILAAWTRYSSRHGRPVTK
jgi:hypothetical protein